MTYYGDGLTVNVYDPDGNLVRTDNVNYDDLTKFRNNTWTYTIPESDTQPYSYEAMQPWSPLLMMLTVPDSLLS